VRAGLAEAFGGRDLPVDVTGDASLFARAAATPAADEPDTNSPGERSGGTGGVSLSRVAP